MLKPAHLLPLGEVRVAVNRVGSVVAQVEQHIQKVEPDAGDQNGRDGYQRNRLACKRPAVQPGAQKGTLVLAKQFLHPLQRNRVDVPGVAGKVTHPLHRAVLRRVKAVVHAGAQAQRHKVALVPGTRVLIRTNQIGQRVGKAFGLEELPRFDAPVRADKSIYRAAHHRRVHVDGPRALLELAGKAVVHAGEAAFFRFTEVEVREVFPDGDGCVAHPGLLDFAEAPHELGQPCAWQAIGQQEVQVFLVQQIFDGLADRHGAQGFS